jgi:diguanylate cyclase (GGDEF)-like protein
MRRLLQNLPLGRKLLLIPALASSLVALMLGVAVHGAWTHTAALSALDRDVFEPLHAAYDLQDRFTLTHAAISALQFKGVIEADRVATRRAAEAMPQRLADEAAFVTRLAESLRGQAPDSLIAQLQRQADAYLADARATIDMAAVDAAFGAILMLQAEQHFQKLRAVLEGLVAALSARREALMVAAVGRSGADERLLVVLAAGCMLVTLVGSALLGRAIVRPLARLTEVVRRGDAATEVPGTFRRDEVGALARAVAAAKVSAAALLRREAELAESNGRLDAALDNMTHGLCMYDAAERLVVANRRFAEVHGLPPGRIRPGMTYREVVGLMVECGWLPGHSAAQAYGVMRAQIASAPSGRMVGELEDGRTVVASFRTMPDGGWVSAHEDITEQRQAEERIAHIAHHDALTGRPNRVLFRKRLDTALAGARRGQSFALLCLDLDRFKEVNDTLGHPVGDALLCAVAERLQGELRETDTLARLGGDEFAIIQAGVEAAGEATALARRLVETIGAPFELDGHQVVVGTSIGITLAPGDGLDADALLKAADLALYRAKGEGRGRWRFFEPEMDERVQQRRALELDLRRALVEGEFELYYQPIVEVASRRVSGLEALLRWHHPERGIVGPDSFIPLAEEIGLIVPIGEWVLKRACAEAVTWPGAPKVAVNLSPAQFANRGLVDAVAAALRGSGLDPARLELEITETVMLEGTEATLATLHQLKALGVSIAMDDFGTGYSSLSYLQRFPFDKVKIDRSFIRNLDQSRQSNAIVRAVTGMCIGLDMTTTAEGVETEAQFEALLREGCREAQGYLFSRPCPATEIRALLARIAPEPTPAGPAEPPARRHSVVLAAE